MLLGVSGSGREDGITAAAVKRILEAADLPYQYVSLSDKKINGCLGCLSCAADNRCRQEDDWLQLGEKLLAAEAVVFGAPNYYGTINALGHAFWERTYCFRHQGKFSLAGKLGVVVGTDDQGATDVIPFVKSMMMSNKMAVVGTLSTDGHAPCYSCGFGAGCPVGSVVSDHGFLSEIEQEHLPPRFSEQKTAVERAVRLGKTLAAMLE